MEQHYISKKAKKGLKKIQKDPNLLNRLNELLASIEQDPTSGIGKPEELVGDLAGYWSRRLDKQHRLVYKVEDEKIIILSCWGHYED
ncbi:MAG: Txe/YoeB family addiction module toxin [Bacteroidota bacterium]